MGTENTYIWVDCRKCVMCMNWPSHQGSQHSRGLEKNIIDKTLTLNSEERVGTAELPLIGDSGKILFPKSVSVRKNV